MDNWVNIDEQTAEIRLNKYPDHESKFLVDGTYYIKVLCISDGKLSREKGSRLAALPECATPGWGDCGYI